MQALILAAGKGARLGTMLNGKPKALLTIGGQPLLMHHVATLQSLGVDRIGIVVGHGAQQVEECAGGDCTLIRNDHYAETNSLYSLWVARTWIDGPFIMINADVLAHVDVYRTVMEGYTTRLAFDSSKGNDDEEMKVEIRDGHVVAIGKTLPPQRTMGESVGIIRFSNRDALRLLREADRMVTVEHVDSWAPAAVDRIAAQTHIRAVDVAHLPWTEIDFRSDFDQAEDSVWPRICVMERNLNEPTFDIRVRKRAQQLLKREHAVKAAIAK